MKLTSKAMEKWAEEVGQNCQDINHVLTGCGVKPHVQTHWTDTTTGQGGLALLIEQILRSAGAEFVAGIEQSPLRTVAICSSLYTEQIIALVQAKFAGGSSRYPDQSVRNYLSTYMTKSGLVGQIKLTNKEDRERSCCRPRTKWYLVAK